MDSLNHDLEKKEQQLAAIRKGRRLILIGFLLLIPSMFVADFSFAATAVLLASGTVTVCYGERIRRRARRQQQNDEEKEKW